MKPLSAKKKAAICMAARRAYEKAKAGGQLQGIDFNTWRHDEVERAVANQTSTPL